MKTMRREIDEEVLLSVLVLLSEHVQLALARRRCKPSRAETNLAPTSFFALYLGLLQGLRNSP